MKRNELLAGRIFVKRPMKLISHRLRLDKTRSVTREVKIVAVLSCFARKTAGWNEFYPIMVQGVAQELRMATFD